MAQKFDPEKAQNAVEVLPISVTDDANAHKIYFNCLDRETVRVNPSSLRETRC
jgi:hypothetical protein